MATRYERRSQEAPMDFEFTDKNRNVIAEDSPFRSALKRPHGVMATPGPSFPQPDPATPTFGGNHNVPFLFNQPPPTPTHSYPWSPSLEARLPPRDPAVELTDISMEDVSPSCTKMPEPSPSERTVATGAMTRVYRTRQKQKDRSRGRGERSRRYDTEEEESEEEDASEKDVLGQLPSVPRPRRGRALQKSHSEPITTTANHNYHYTFSAPKAQLSHSEIPYLLLGYLQFFFNLSLVLGLLYLVYQFICTVQKDVEHKMVEFSLESLQEIRLCEKLYLDNYCGHKPSPIIAHQCQEWKICMERDASIVGKTKLLAELIGEVINGFMEPITWRTMIFTTTSLALGIAFVNSLLMFYRARHAPVSHQVPPSASAPIYNSHSIPYWGQTPAPPFPHMLPPGTETRKTWSSGVETDEMLETPSRRRKLTEDETVKIR